MSDPFPARKRGSFFLLFPSSVDGGGRCGKRVGAFSKQRWARSWRPRLRHGPRPQSSAAAARWPPERDDRALRAAMVDVVIEDARGHHMSGSAADSSALGDLSVFEQRPALTADRQGELPGHIAVAKSLQGRGHLVPRQLTAS